MAAAMIGRLWYKDMPGPVLRMRQDGDDALTAQSAGAGVIRPSIDAHPPARTARCHLNRRLSSLTAWKGGGAKERHVPIEMVNFMTIHEGVCDANHQTDASRPACDDRRGMWP